jgi:hypothetical protein
MFPKILVLHAKKSKLVRKTIDDYLYSFKRYGKGSKFYYFNALRGIPKILTRISFDAVIIHYTLLAQRYFRNDYQKFLKSISNLKLIKVPKIIFPQDEYNHTNDLLDFINEFDVKTVFSCAQKSEFFKLYGLKNAAKLDYFHVYPGYADENTLKRIDSYFIPSQQRTIDIGYRGRKLPFWTGRYTQKKFEIGERVKEYCKKMKQVKVDIDSEVGDELLGDDWLKFLVNCKSVLGCESGATLMDKDGSIRDCVEDYLRKNPNATFEEAEARCFPNMEGNIKLLTISPRHFEAAMTRTCQILLEGSYSGIMKPNVHYIPLKHDYSDMKEAVNKSLDKKFREFIIKNAYQDLILSGEYGYKKFVEKVIKPLRSKRNIKKKETSLYLNNLNELIFIFHIISANLTFYFKNIWNKIKYLMFILPGSTVKQWLVKNNLWPLKVSDEYLKRIQN